MSADYLDGLLASRPAGVEVPSVFIETGTFHGKTAATAAAMFDLVHTIELSKVLHQEAVGKFADRPEIHCHQGDSAVVLPELLRNTPAPAVIYLDAHWFHRQAGQPEIPQERPFPLWAELAAIADRPHADWVIVDDAGLFGRTEHAWPIDPRWRTVTVARILDVLGRGRLAGHALYGDCLVVWRTVSGAA